MNKTGQGQTTPPRFLHNLVRMDSPPDILEEAGIILKMIRPDFDCAPVNTAFNFTVRLFNGDCPGYQACNTDYHDLYHTTDTFLAMARLIHGGALHHEEFTDRQVILGLIAALLHDSGYIQAENDTAGTGAKYTTTHVRRSMDFLADSGAELGLTEDEIATGRAMILCTDLAVAIDDVEFPNPKTALLGKMLGAADILAQTADRLYLEKLLFLFYEFKESMIGDYIDEVDLLRKTIGFYDIIDKRLKPISGTVDLFLTAHLAERWQIQENLYFKAVQNNKKFLVQILAKPGEDPRGSLKRSNIVKRVREKYGETE